jgi:hypothetical protein
LQQFVASPRTVDYKTMPIPPAQPNMPGVSGSSVKHTAVKGKTVTRAPLANTGVKTSFAIGGMLLAMALLLSRWVDRSSIRRSRY